MNYYERPAQQQFIDTHAALPFQEMMALGQAYKQERDKTEAALDAYKAQYGDFQSMSKKDLESWDKTIGVINPAIEQMSTNPEYIKSQEGQAEIRRLIRSVDTSKLGMLKQSAENLQKRAQIIAQMKAQGKYNESWDDINIGQWDTLGSNQIMTDLAPIEYMNAADLSAKYFDQMKPGTIGAQWKDGVKYQVTGNTEEDLRSIAMSKAGDLINTPQGKKYYEQFLQQAGGDQAKATAAFQDMIVSANRDRIIRPTLTVDPAWMLQQRQTAAKKSGKQPAIPEPTLIDFTTKSQQEAIKGRMGQDILSYRSYIEGLTTKYGPDSKITQDAKQGLIGIDRELKRMDEGQQARSFATQQANAYLARYNQTGKDSDLIAATKLSSIADAYGQDTQVRAASLLNRAAKPLARMEFKKAAGFELEEVNDPNKFSAEGYLQGVKRANSMYEFGLSDKVSKDILLNNAGGLRDKITDKDGSKRDAYQFNTSEGFMLPETLFNLSIGKIDGRKVQREGGPAVNIDFPLKEIIESGRLPNVQFIPNNKYQRVIDGREAVLVAKGKLRIPKEALRDIVGTGILVSDSGWRSFFSGMGTLGVGLSFSKESVDSAMKRLFQAGTATEAVGDDGIDYYEIDIARPLPNSAEYQQTTNQLWKNTEGIGGASHEKDTFQTSAEQTLGD